MLSNLFLIGDFNVDVSNHSYPLFSKLFSVTNSFSLYQVVRGFTHYNHSGNHSIIDLAFVSAPVLLIVIPFPLFQLLTTTVLLFLFIQVLYQRDPPPVLAEVHGAMLVLIFTVLVNLWTRLIGTVLMSISFG